MTMITPSYLGETIEYSSLHACRSTLEDPTQVQKVLFDNQSDQIFNHLSTYFVSASRNQRQGNRSKRICLPNHGAVAVNKKPLITFTDGREICNFQLLKRSWIS